MPWFTFMRLSVTGVEMFETALDAEEYLVVAVAAGFMAIALSAVVRNRVGNYRLLAVYGAGLLAYSVVKGWDFLSNVPDYSALFDVLGLGWYLTYGGALIQFILPATKATSD